MTIIKEKKEELKLELGESWFRELQQEFEKDYMNKLMGFLEKDSQEFQIFPPFTDTFNAFKYCPLSKLKVVILGQDPYHNLGQAHGLCFSVQAGIKPPPSLVNIFKELETDIDGFTRPQSGELTSWAKQGIFLLNTCLSVRAHQAGSHFNQGWEIFTDKVIQVINEKKEGVVFLLWGAAARKKASLITNRCLFEKLPDARLASPKQAELTDTSMMTMKDESNAAAGTLQAGSHLVLEAPHPSPLSAHRGFLGCKHFSQANAHLINQSKEAIDWVL
jgi:uracil-DNA glycosylase